MTPDELREKVARALWETHSLSAFIDASIAIVLEEAARVADAAERQADDDARYWEVSAGLRCQDIAAAIRAMKNVQR